MEYAKVIQSVCVAYNQNKVHLTGASFGGALAHSTADATSTMEGAHVGSLLLVDPPPPGLQALKYRGRCLTKAMWRTVAATSLLTRSSQVANKPMSFERAMMKFVDLPSDELDVVFAQQLSSFGMGGSTMSAVVDTKRRLDVWVHSQVVMLASAWGSRMESKQVSESSLLLLSSLRDYFFGEGASAECLAKFFSAELLVLEGDHLAVMSTCAMGRDASFNFCVSSQLSAGLREQH